MIIKPLKIRPEIPDEIVVSPKGVSINYYDRMGKKVALGEVTKKGVARYYSYWLDSVLLVLSWVTWIPIWSLRKTFFQLAGLKIDPKVHIHTGCRFYQPSGIEIGEDSIVGFGCFLDGRENLKIGKHVDIASEVMIYNSEHDIASEDFAPISAPVVISDYVFIGPRAIILPGVTIGRGAVIGAGAVVTKDIPEFTVVGGVPAIKIGERKIKEPHYILGRARLFQ